MFLLLGWYAVTVRVYLIGEAVLNQPEAEFLLIFC